MHDRFRKGSNLTRYFQLVVDDVVSDVELAVGAAEVDAVVAAVINVVATAAMNFLADLVAQAAGLAVAELERAAAVVSSGVAATPVVAFLDATDIVAVGATAAQLAAGLIAVGTGGRAAAAAAVAAPAVVAARSPEYEPSVGKTWA